MPLHFPSEDFAATVCALAERLLERGDHERFEQLVEAFTTSGASSVRDGREEARD